MIRALASARTSGLGRSGGAAWAATISPGATLRSTSLRSASLRSAAGEIVDEGGEENFLFKLIPILALLSKLSRESCLSYLGTEGAIDLFDSGFVIRPSESKDDESGRAIRSEEQAAPKRTFAEILENVLRISLCNLLRLFRAVAQRTEIGDSAEPPELPGKVAKSDQVLSRDKRLGPVPLRKPVQRSRTPSRFEETAEVGDPQLRRRSPPQRPASGRRT
jgi:hypothetical protein